VIAALSTPNRKQVLSWAFYDWANSAFATTIMAGFIQAFYGKFWHPGATADQSTFELQMTNAATGILVALAAPLMGAIADRGGAKKKLLFLFTAFGVVGSALLAMPGQGQYALALLFYGIGAIGFSGANIFYDSLLVDVAPEDKLDSVSSLGYAMGYLGGGVLFAINAFMVNSPGTFGIPDQTAAVRIAFASVAVWWAVFSAFLFMNVREKPATSTDSFATLARQGFGEVAKTFRALRLHRAALVFVCGYVFYIDGVNTVIKVAVQFGSSLGFGTGDLMKALLLVQFVAFPAALAFGWLGGRIGARRGILVGIVAYAFITILGSRMTQASHFYMLAVAVGLFQGGIQALSRSYFASLIPAEKAGEFFGFYNMVGKFTAIMGVTLTAVVSKTTGNVRWGMASIAVLFFVGGAILLMMKDERKAG